MNNVLPAVTLFAGALLIVMRQFISKDDFDHKKETITDRNLMKDQNGKY
jgi:hypothetical protein